MTINTIKFSQFAAGSLANSNFSVGVTSLSGGTNYQIPATNVWTTGGRPVTPITGTIGYNSSLSQVEYWNGASWVQLASGGSGTVGLGGAGQIAYYEFSGTAVAGTNTIPNTVQTQGIINGTSSTAGDVGELISSIVLNSGAVNLPFDTPTNLTSITLTPGDWNVWGTVTVQDSGGGNIANAAGAISTTSATLSDEAFNDTIITDNYTIGAYTAIPVMLPMNVTINTVVYLVGYAYFDSGTVNMRGAIYARRVR